MSIHFVAMRTIDEHEGRSWPEAELDEAFRRHRCEVLALDEEPHVIDGEWRYVRTALLGFPDAAAAESWACEPDVAPWAPGYFLIPVDEPDGIRVEVVRYRGHGTVSGGSIGKLEVA